MMTWNAELHVDKKDTDETSKVLLWSGVSFLRFMLGL